MSNIIDAGSGNDNYIEEQTTGNFTNHVNVTYEIPEIPAYIRTTSMVICITIMILGVIGNIMVPIVILKTKDMRNSTNIFLTNLSIADLLVLLICCPTVLVEVNTPPETWVLGKEMCKAVPFIELTVAHASVLTILAISFERYYAICEPLKAGYVCTKTRALLICLIAWAIAALFTSPILSIARYDIETYVDGSNVAVCLTSVDTFWSSAYFVGSISIFFLIPFLILLILYSIIAKHLMSNPRLLSHNGNTQHGGGTILKYRKQVIFMLGTVVLSFFICLLPFRALTLWIIIVPPEAILSLGVEGYYNLLYFCRIMLYLNSAMNPILYNLMSTKFRDGFLKLLGCRKLVKSNRSRAYGMNERKGTFHTTSTNVSSTSSSRKEYHRTNSNSLRFIRNDSITSSEDAINQRDELSSGFVSGASVHSEEENDQDKKLGSIIKRLPQNFEDIQEIDEHENENYGKDCNQSDYELMMVRRAYLKPFFIHKTITQCCGPANSVCNKNICDENEMHEINLNNHREVSFKNECCNDNDNHKIMLDEDDFSEVLSTTRKEYCNNLPHVRNLNHNNLNTTAESKEFLVGTFTKGIATSKESFV